MKRAVDDALLGQSEAAHADRRESATRWSCYGKVLRHYSANTLVWVASSIVNPLWDTQPVQVTQHIAYLKYGNLLFIYVPLPQGYSATDRGSATFSYCLLIYVVCN